MLKPGEGGQALACSWDDAPHSTYSERDQVTIETWVYLDAYPEGADNRRWLVGKNANEHTEGHYALVIAGRTAGAYLNIGGGQENFHQAGGTTDMLTLGKWHHLAMTYDGAVLQMYFDGTPAGSKTVNRERIAGDGPVSTGKRVDGHGEFTEGRLDEIRLYRRALSADEIKAHFVAPADVPAYDNGMVRYWGFDADIHSVSQKKLQEVVAQAGLQPAYRKKLLT